MAVSTKKKAESVRTPQKQAHEDQAIAQMEAIAKQLPECQRAVDFLTHKPNRRTDMPLRKPHSTDN